jgi:hypothetical protein
MDSQGMQYQSMQAPMQVPYQQQPQTVAYYQQPEMSTMKKVLIGLFVLAIIALVYWYFTGGNVTLFNVKVETGDGKTNTILVPDMPSDQKPAQLPVVVNSPPVEQPIIKQVPVSPLVGKFNADDHMSIQVNGVEVYSEQGIGWTTQHNVNIPNVKTGAKVSFIVRNTGGPGGLIGSFQWNGKTYNVNSKLFPGNATIAEGDANVIWGSWVANQYPADADWLWSNDNCDKCTHTFTWIAE